MSNGYRGETREVIAKEITLAIIEKIGLPGANTEPEALGERAGKLYRAILEQIKGPEEGSPQVTKIQRF
jgi:hypothetical protein